MRFMRYSALHFSDMKSGRHAESLDESLAMPERARIKKFFEYWKSKCPSGGYPSREDIIPEEIAPLLCNVFLALILDEEPVDYVYRLVGTEIVELEGECTGLRLSEMLPDRERFSSLWQHYADLREGKIWLRVEALPHRERGHMIQYEILLLPLQDEDGEIRKIFGYAHEMAKR